MNTDEVDRNVIKVLDKYIARAAMGKLKYGVTTERDDLSLEEWMVHLQHELMDATIYLEKLIKESKSSA